MTSLYRYGADNNYSVYDEKKKKKTSDLPVADTLSPPSLPRLGPSYRKVSDNLDIQKQSNEAVNQKLYVMTPKFTAHDRITSTLHTKSGHPKVY